MKNYFSLFDPSQLVVYKTKSQIVAINRAKSLILSNLAQRRNIQTNSEMKM